jgi:NAD(P)-dependent dehydrogenase (short-subunit alcohol dehydrogenase family)
VSSFRFYARSEILSTQQKYDRIIPLQGDVTSRESLLSLAETVKARHGHIDLLINNAGIARNLFSHPLPSPSSLTDKSSSPTSIKAFQSALWNAGSPDDFADTFATNVTAVYYTTVAFLDLLHQGNIRQQLQEQVGTNSDHLVLRRISSGRQSALAIVYCCQVRLHTPWQIACKLIGAMGYQE